MFQASSSGSMPLLFNEPFSVLQRMAEEMEYTALLSTYVCPQACSDSQCQSVNRPYCSSMLCRRFCNLQLCRFSSSEYSQAMVCHGFKIMLLTGSNPLLGETFEFDRPDLGFRFLAEKVSHLPMQTASHAEGLGWVSRGLMQVKQGRKKACESCCRHDTYLHQLMKSPRSAGSMLSCQSGRKRINGE